MKKVVIALTLIAGVAFATAPFNVTVGTSSIKLVAKKSAKNGATTWETGKAYSQGDVVKNGNNYYFATAAGTAGSTAPTHTTGEVTDDNILWRYINANERSGVVVTVQTDSVNGGAINLSLGNTAATASSGLRLVGEGASVIFSGADDYQGAIYAISSTGSNVVVGVQEF